MRRVLVVLVVGGLLAGCAYPRRPTSLTPVAAGAEQGVPDHLWRVRLASAEIPTRQRSGLTWDEHGGRPDPYVRFFVGGRMVYESPTLDDTTSPAWDVELPANLHTPPDEEIRIELWDRDQFTSDPVGIWRNHGLPSSALEDADVRILTENGASIVFRVQRPRAHRGVGIRLYEVRGSELLVLEVIPRSPAGRAGVRARDRIVGIGGRTVADLGEARAATAVSMAAERGESLAVVRESGEREELQLDRGFVWLTL